MCTLDHPTWFQETWLLRSFALLTQDAQCHVVVSEEVVHLAASVDGILHPGDLADIIQPQVNGVAHTP